MYKILKRAIEKQIYPKEELQEMIDVYYLSKRITKEEYLELDELLANS